MTEKELVHMCFECCRQIVRSYGPSDLPEHVRKRLCVVMDHYEKTSKLEKLEDYP